MAGRRSQKATEDRSQERESDGVTNGGVNAAAVAKRGKCLAAHAGLRNEQLRYGFDHSAPAWGATENGAGAVPISLESGIAHVIAKIAESMITPTDAFPASPLYS